MAKKKSKKGEPSLRKKLKQKLVSRKLLKGSQRATLDLRGKEEPYVSRFFKN